MNKILISIKSPTTAQRVAQTEWWKTVNTLQGDADTNTGVQMLTAGAWLILGHDGLPFLGTAISGAEHHKFSYRILIVGEDIDWSHEPVA
jgi:hypothetical protein